MGITKLSELGKTGDPCLAVAAAVLRAELADGRWRSDDEFLDSYPRAVPSDSGFRIFLEGDYAVDLIVNFSTGMMLIDSVAPVCHSEAVRVPGGRP